MESKGELSANAVVEMALKQGFDDCGISRVQTLSQDAALMETWLSKEYHGTMHYLGNNREKRYNPALLVEGARTVISVLYNYFPTQPQPHSHHYKISKYAFGKDYHHIIRRKLKDLLDDIQQVTGPVNARVFTDSAPVLDRAWAQKSGLGFIGKNSCLIHPRKGSFFFIGHIITTLELPETPSNVHDYCGTCRRCIDACPTGAIVEAHVLDARKCISYLTIEYKGEMPAGLKSNFENWIFGCDICQDVCPWNKFSKPHQEPLFAMSESLKAMNRNDWETMDQSKFEQLFGESAIKRTGFAGLKRNIRFLTDSSETE